MKQRKNADSRVTETAAEAVRTAWLGLLTHRKTTDQLLFDTWGATFELAVRDASYLDGFHTGQEQAEAREKRLRDALEMAMQLIDSGGFKNGVTDSTGSIDEGEVRASRIYHDLRAALSEQETPR